MIRPFNSAPFWLDPDTPDIFPDVELALNEPDGLLAVGGDLSAARLVAAYEQGIFPWYSEGELIMWWSPDPRALLFVDELHLSRSLKKTLRHRDYEVRFDQQFARVIENCAAPRRDGLGTWIVEDMKQAYCHLHELGIAHSIEVYRNNELAGGLYGVSRGHCFFGESMFSHQPDTSKIALVYLSRQLQRWQFPFIDCQVYSEHLGRLGARKIARKDFIALLNRHVHWPADYGKWQCEITADNLFD